MKEKVASELSRKALSDTTRYDAKEIGHAQLDDIERGLRECIELHRNIIDEPEFCIVFVLAKDPLIHNLTRRKFYAWPYLPSPRPDQSVFLYNKGLDRITKRLWVMPKAEVMAELATKFVTDEIDQRQQAWCIAFFKGTFWDYIRHEHKINMPSEREFFLAHRDELLKAGCKLPDANFSDAFDFSKIAIEKVVDTQEPAFNQESLCSLRQA